MYVIILYLFFYLNLIVFIYYLAIGNNFNIRDASIADLAEKISSKSNTQYAVWVSFYEIYNDQVFDLLTMPVKKDAKRAVLKIREDPKSHVPYVEGLIHIPVFNTSETLKILKFGERNLQKSSNSVNQSSSRSHAIFTMKLVSIEDSHNLFQHQ